MMKSFLFCLILALCCQSGWCDRFSDALARAEKGDSEDQYNLGIMYSMGMGVPKNDAKAFEWIMKAAEQGHIQAQFNTGMMYGRGEGVPQNDEKALTWVLKSAEHGGANIQCELGTKYIAVGNYEKALEYYTKAANLGSPYALLNIGEMHLKGNGVPKDNEIALDFYSKAFEMFGTDQKQTKVTEWYKNAADKGFSDAKVKLAFIFLKEYNVIDAHNLFIAAGNAGNLQAQIQLGKIYLRGLSFIKPDKAKAMKWYKKAAEQGDIDAQEILGGLYMEVENYEEALAWSLKSAERGNVYSQLQVGKIYHPGKGFSKDFVKFYAWISVACVEKPELKAYIDSVSSSMALSK
jgi:uncharacterized protein